MQGGKALLKKGAKEGTKKTVKDAAKKEVKETAKKKTKSGFSVTNHGVSRKIEREVRSCDILDALKKPLKVKPVKTDAQGRMSQKYVGKRATVSINPTTKKIIQTNSTSSRVARNLMKDQ